MLLTIKVDCLITDATDNFYSKSIDSEEIINV